MIFSIYGVQNLRNGKLYVGYTSGTIEHRWRQHVATAFRGEDNKFYRAIRKYGRDAFSLEMLGSYGNKNEALAAEVLLIRILDTIASGYNTAYGGTDGMRTPWVVAGITYDSKLAAAQAHGIYYPKMMKRLALGHTPEQAAGIEPLPCWKTGVVVVQGISYPSRSAAARAFAVDPKTVIQRINVLGWSLEQALGLEPGPERGAWNSDTVIVDDTPLSRAAAARAIGYNSAAVSVQMKRSGCSAQEAFEILRERAKARS